jgi:hypothetical protein
VRHFGPRWAAYRARYALARRSGWLARRETIRAWEDAPLLWEGEAPAEPGRALRDRPRKFFFTSDQLLQYQPLLCAFDTAEQTSVRDAQRLAGGEFKLFHVQHAQLGLPPNWHRNAISGEEAPPDEHWSRIPDFAFGDIKVIWDVSRFACAFDLVRAYWRTRDEAWPELFWTLIDDWHAHNPPNHGANWKCGQEASLRAMAWCFGLFGFLGSPASTPERIARLVQLLVFTGQRVAKNIHYALSQKNNHGISEAMGLFTIGLLFPELRQAQQWRDLGRTLLESQARELIYDDGSFAQHSWNYHRLMLHEYVWSMRLSEVSGEPLSEELKSRVGRAAELLYQVQDETTGEVPCYGHDDGSLVLPLCNCSYFDYRPVVQAAVATTDQRRVYPSGPWDEDLLWLFGPDYHQLAVMPAARSDVRAADGGYVTLRSDGGFAFTRAASFRHRPAHADMLHVDLWWCGQNVAIDPGTFSYNAPPSWSNALASSLYHNTVTVDGHDQMARAGRFLWLPWLKAWQSVYAPGGGLWQGEHEGYQRLWAGVKHLRSIQQLGAAHWFVLDRLMSPGQHDYRLHWLLADFAYAWSERESTLQLDMPAGPYHVTIGTSAAVSDVTLVRADEHSPRGWRARGYQRRQPAISLALAARGESVVFWTLLGLASDALKIDRSDDAIHFAHGDWQATVLLASGASSSDRGVQGRTDLEVRPTAT